MVLQVPEAQVVAALSTRSKMLNTSEVVKWKVGPLCPRRAVDLHPRRFRRWVVRLVVVVVIGFRWREI